MISASTYDQTHLQKFQNLLRELFQFDSADLDFGIYRIMNHKRDVIETFISEDLPARITAELETGQLAQQSVAVADFEATRQEVLENFGGDAIDSDGELDDAYSQTPLGVRYLEQKAAAETGRSRQAVETDIYNHLFTFFSRYYQEGDFISRRRYSRNQRYAIPYNGEEVYLHWANSDQYYVKTSEYFHNYDWIAPNGVSVRFQLITANVEQNNVRGDKRFFVPLEDNTTWDPDARDVTVPFEYRPLTEEEKSRYGNRDQQTKIIEHALGEIPGRMDEIRDVFTALTGEHRRTGDDQPISRLDHHMRRYTRRNQSDFFIHKDLGSFLKRELDFYLKNEVLNLDNLEAAGEQTADGWFQQLRLVKSIGSEIIDFVSQVEDFQKMLWEKRKFVVDTHYCVTLANVHSDFYPQIVDNDAQWEEWRELLEIGAADRSESFLETQPTLQLDTRHFDTAFTDGLLASFDDLHGMTDGLIIHSENWQALSLIEENYRGRIKCVYIDPPYNTAASEILYKNNYRHSSWAALLANRLSVSKRFLLDDGVLGLAIDDTELKLAIAILEQEFAGYEVQPIVVHHYPGSGSGRGNVSSTHEYHLMVVPQDRDILVGSKRDGGIRIRNFRRSGQGENNHRWGRPNSFFAILVDPHSNQIKGMEQAVPDGAEYPTGPTPDGFLRVYPIGRNGSERVWSRNRESSLELLRLGRLECTAAQTIVQHIENEGRKVLTSVWLDSKFNAVVNGTNLLADILGRGAAFPYPKSVFTVSTAIDAVLGDDLEATVLDFFAGSGTTGHAVINLNREDGGDRRFILVEMGEYFDTVLLPRIKKVTFTPEWKDGRPQRAPTPEEVERSPRIVKYIRLESYEDALDGIETNEEPGRLNLLDSIDGYLLKYMLTWETRQSETLLNATKLTRPFDYRLRAYAQGESRERTADVAETFNYLLGLDVRTRQVYEDDGKRYLVYRGATREAPGRGIAVIWRQTEGWTEEDFARDREFVKENNLDGEADTVYVNGNSVIPGAKAIEPLFKARMFAGVSA